MVAQSHKFRFIIQYRDFHVRSAIFDLFGSRSHKEPIDTLRRQEPSELNINDNVGYQKGDLSPHRSW